MKFKFILRPDYVFLHAINIAQMNKPFSGWGEYTNKIYEENPAVFYFLAGAPEYETYLSDSLSYKTLSDLSDNVLNAQKEIPEYKRLIEETEAYINFLEDQWGKNENEVLKIVSELTGLSIPDISINVFVTHPKLRNGFSLDKNNLAWGHPEDFKNYSTVYLCHELMHILTDLDDSDITHAIIELLIDNELRIRLNKGGKYFEQKGHSKLVELEKKILPYWQEYLKKSNKNINDFIVSIKQKIG